ncbi:hypothetical protein AC1031_005841 [Aphanomyces cochlioides]|nr:hypothetical protein AC1031_005841 [Aphanomyces cochlioides]
MSAMDVVVRQEDLNDVMTVLRQRQGAARTWREANPEATEEHPVWKCHLTGLRDAYAVANYTSFRLWKTSEMLPAGTDNPRRCVQLYREYGVGIDLVLCLAGVALLTVSFALSPTITDPSSTIRFIGVGLAGLSFYRVGFVIGKLYGRIWE